MAVQLGALPAGRSRAELVAEVATALADVPRGAAVLIACSAGPDSTALAFLTAEARPDLQASLAHIRHGLRDDAADLEVVRQHAAWLAVPLLVAEVDVTVAGRGLEAAARDARYAALRDLAVRAGAHHLLVGHTADDQAETVLLRLARGSGLTGLSAMARRRDDVVRPLLRLRRSDVRRYVLLEGLPHVDDPTNTDPAIRRTVARHEVLPLLDEVGPDPVGALARLADLARDDDVALTGWAEEVLAAAARPYGPVVALREAELAAAPVAVARRAVRLALQDLTGGPALDAAAVSRLLELEPGQSLDLPGGMRATKGGGWLAVGPRGATPHDPVPLAVPGITPWPPAGVVITALTPDAPAPAGQLSLGFASDWAVPAVSADPGALPPGGDPARGHLAVPDGLGPLQIRTRSPGDRLVARAGHRRLQDALVDAGVPRAVRDLLPVVVAGDRVVWVPGVIADTEVVDAGRLAPTALLVVRSA